MTMKVKRKKNMTMMMGYIDVEEREGGDRNE